MILTAIKELAVQHDAQVDVLRVEWIEGQPMRHFRSAFESLQKMTKQLQVSRILLDIDKLPDIPVYDQLWLSTHFMPVLTRLPLERAVIILSSQRVYNQHVVEGLLAAARLQIRFDLQFFTQADSAMHWLTDNSPRLPALLAEWEQAHPNPTPRPGEVAEPRLRYERR